MMDKLLIMTLFMLGWLAIGGGVLIILITSHEILKDINK